MDKKLIKKSYHSINKKIKLFDCDPIVVVNEFASDDIKKKLKNEK